MIRTAARSKRIALTVNGRRHDVEIPARRTLAEMLRQDLGLIGTKVGCNRAECGSCTVVLDGRAVFACSVLAVEAAGRNVTTVEGLAGPEGLHPLQEAFIEHDAVQCGIGIPGILMSLRRCSTPRSRPRRTTCVRPSPATSAAAAPTRTP